MGANAKITVHPSYEIGEISGRLFSAFLEPIGTIVNGTMFNPKHPTADEQGFRTDFIKALKKTGLPAGSGADAGDNRTNANGQGIEMCSQSVYKSFFCKSLKKLIVQPFIGILKSASKIDCPVIIILFSKLPYYI